MGEQGAKSFLDRSIGHQLGRTYNHFWQACADRLRSHRMTPKQFSLLSLVCRHPGISQSEICARTVSKPPQVADLLDSLAGRGLIRRETPKADRRKRLWWPTRSGIAKEEALQRKVIDAEQEVCATRGFSERKRDTLFRLLFEINNRNGDFPLGVPEEPLPARELRDVAGSFATGVTVIATRKGRGVHGMTANSFLSVSLSPALVLFSLETRSRMRSMLAVGKPVGISILAKGQEAISDHFANRGRIDFDVFEEGREAPIVRDAHASYEVVLQDVVLAGDHELFICRVERMRRHGGEPLVFHGGAYTTIAREDTA